MGSTIKYTIDDVNSMQQINTIKLYIPGTLRFYENDSNNIISIHGNDSVIVNNIIYEIKDSVLNIKLKKGTYREYNVQDNDLMFNVKLKSDIPNIITSNDLILSKTKMIKNIEESNHEKSNN